MLSVAPVVQINSETIVHKIVTLLQLCGIDVSDQTYTFAVAGGVFRSIITGSQIRDIDLFVGDDASAERLESVLGTPRYVSEFSKTYGIRSNIIQVIDVRKIYPNGPVYCRGLKAGKDWFNSITWIMNFDFTIAMMCYWPQCNMLFAHLNTLSDIYSKRLYIPPDVTLSNPLGTMFRAVKFIRQGYTIDVPSLFKIVLALIDKYKDATGTDILRVLPLAIQEKVRFHVQRCNIDLDTKIGAQDWIKIVNCLLESETIVGLLYGDSNDINALYMG